MARCFSWVVCAQDTDQKEWRDRRLEGTWAESDLKRDPGPFTAAVWRSSREMVPERTWTYIDEDDYTIIHSELIKRHKTCKELLLLTCYMQSLFLFWRDSITYCSLFCCLFDEMGWFFLCAFGAGRLLQGMQCSLHGQSDRPVMFWSTHSFCHSSKEYCTAFRRCGWWSNCHFI